MLIHDKQTSTRLAHKRRDLTAKGINNLMPDLTLLTPKEREIYNAIMRIFPATDPFTAYDKALEGGVRFNFIYT